MRHTLFGGTNYMKDTLVARRQTVALLPDDHHDKPTRTHNLAVSLRAQFDSSGIMAALDESIMLERQASSSENNDLADRAMILDGLSISLSDRYKLEGNRRDLDDAILASESAVSGSLDDQRKPGYLNNLANRLSHRFRRHNNRSDLDEAVSKVKEALRAVTEESHSHRILYMTTLSNMLAERFDAFRSHED
ncbi:hypothetical protein MBLNU230_g6589t1 [Neophaeotheca triangularis]